MIGGCPDLPVHHFAIAAALLMGSQPQTGAGCALGVTGGVTPKPRDVGKFRRNVVWIPNRKPWSSLLRLGLHSSLRLSLTKHLG